MSILIIDTETTGLPNRPSFNKYYNPMRYNHYDSSRLIEIGYIIYNEQGEKIKENSFLIKTNNFKIENSHIHGITQIDTDTNGIDIDDGLNKLNEDLQNIKVIVAHNLLFDINIILAECYRNENSDLIKTIKSKLGECSMKLAKKKFKLTKYPKLINLYEMLFNEKPIQEHRALSDCELCGKCYFKLKKK
tara:strand:- start:437 stop:1006 length:570 start_codon:yes stop_codon:yes gene_type:complete